MTMIPEYEHLFSSNMDFVISHFGADFAKKAHERELSTEESLEANRVLSDVLYPDGVADLLRNGHFPDVVALSSENTRKITSKNSSGGSLLTRNTGLVLVRPEMFHAYRMIEDFLLARGFEIKISLDKKVDFNHYWAIYNDGLIDPDSFLDFPTRTLIYTSGHCRLIIFNDPEDRYGESMMDEFCRSLKGKEGIAREGTIRGDLVLKELFRIGVGDRSNKDVEFSLDPIGMYRHIVDGNVLSDNIHERCDYPFMHYVGAGVHIPNSSEISLDFRVLLDGKENIING